MKPTPKNRGASTKKITALPAKRALRPGATSQPMGQKWTINTPSRRKNRP